MKNILRKIVLYWSPPILWMGLIFYFSSRTRISVADDYIVNFLFFKTLHIAEYAILYFLIFRSFNTLKINAKRVFFYSLTISILYAISDEIHQLLIPSREGRIRDVLIDTLGIFLMYIYIRYKLPTLKKLL